SGKLGGGGGGKDDFAQGGGPNSRALQESFSAITQALHQ
ncbi:MAG: hypothetical protein EBX75_03705, partial [Actinobacteria bacterium]|nr:hypothetical protein [Actinomycetota bacterium]